MEFDNSFEIPLPPDQAWPVLMDVAGIAPCMPGAELTEIMDARNYKGKISVRLGPVSLAFAGKVALEDVDDVKHTARVKAQGNDAKGRGAANAAATFKVEPKGAGSVVVIHTDLMLSGAVAQYGRGVGMIQATAAQIIGQFANNLRAKLAQRPAAAAPAPSASTNAASAPPSQASPVSAAASAPMPPAAKPISGFSLMLRVILQQIAALFGRRPNS
ncbi:MAG TPA: SRPBCC family protein [Xanthobacteraceae bacterium]|jgi:carbon monoxide dehydrogenase subunit G|nr:SRPBCC family protein [Xanthobacteraceae bacterium]